MRASASGLGANPFSSNLAKTKRSIGFRTHFPFFTWGGFGSVSSRHAQCLLRCSSSSAGFFTIAQEEQMATKATLDITRKFTFIVTKLKSR